MYWIAFDEGARRALKMARRTLAPELPGDHIGALCDDLSRGDLSDLRGAEVLDRCKEAVLWFGDNARERCGMLFAVSRLHARGVPVWLAHVDAMPLNLRAKRLEPDCDDGARYFVTTRKGREFRRPQWALRRLYDHRQRVQERRRLRGDMMFFAGAFEMSPEEAGYFYEHRRLLSGVEGQRLAARWHELTNENTPLRVLEHGELCSAQEDYYDGLVLSALPCGAVPASHIIGSVLTRHHLGLDGAFLFERLRALAAQGRVTIVQDGNEAGDLIVRRGG